jgi:hypothetical protein
MAGSAALARRCVRNRRPLVAVQGSDGIRFNDSVLSRITNPLGWMRWSASVTAGPGVINFVDGAQVSLHLSESGVMSWVCEAP